MLQSIEEVLIHVHQDYRLNSGVSACKQPVSVANSRKFTNLGNGRWIVGLGSTGEKDHRSCIMRLKDIWGHSVNICDTLLMRTQSRCGRHFFICGHMDYDEV